MNQFLEFLLLYLIGLWLPLSQATKIEPAKDARSFFAAKFYRRTVVDLGKNDKDILVSPAAAQKLITAIYKGTEANHADRMLFDIGIKHIDMERWIADSIKEINYSDQPFRLDLRDRQIKELTAEIIDKDDVIKYFEEDFNNTKGFVKYENYILTPAGLNVKTDYKDFAKSYFNADVINVDSTEIVQIKEKFGDIYKDTGNVQLFSSIEIKVKIKDSYTLANGNINAVLEARFCEDKGLQFIVLPLDNGLKLFVSIANSPKEFNFFITQIIGFRMKTFEDYKAAFWKTETVSVHLPTFKFKTVNDLAVHFRAVSTQGMKKSLESDAKLIDGFENWPENGPKIEHFWQLVAVRIQSGDKADTVQAPHTKTFDAIGKNVFFAIYNDKDFFLMGHHIAAA